MNSVNFSVWSVNWFFKKLSIWIFHKPVGKHLSVHIFFVLFFFKISFLNWICQKKIPESLEYYLKTSCSKGVWLFFHFYISIIRIISKFWYVCLCHIFLSFEINKPIHTQDHFQQIRLNPICLEEAHCYQEISIRKKKIIFWSSTANPRFK